MSSIDKLISYQLNKLEQLNVDALREFKPEKGELRVDSKGKLYTLTHNSCFSPLINFFKKWINEGWDSDRTLAQRLSVTLENTQAAEAQARVSQLAQSLLHCFGIPKNREHRDQLLRDFPGKIGFVPETYQDVILDKAKGEIEALRGLAAESENRLGPKFPEIFSKNALLDALSVMIDRIEKGPNFPNQTQRDVWKMFTETLADPVGSAAKLLVPRLAPEEEAAVAQEPAEAPKVQIRTEKDAKEYLLQSVQSLRGKMLAACDLIRPSQIASYTRVQFDAEMNEIAATAQRAVHTGMPQLRQQLPGLEKEIAQAEADFVRIISIAKTIQDGVAYPQPIPQQLLALFEQKN